MKLVMSSPDDEAAGRGDEAVLAVLPVWARSQVCEALTGVPDGVLRKLVNDGQVRARKMDPAKKTSACVFRVRDVLDWLEKEAGKPEKFKMAGEADLVDQNDRVDAMGK